jgi:rfaE bifunctional protein nucleotidyltransferase chain/domain
MNNLMTLEQAKTYCERLRSANQTIVFTNGHFDLLHVGHLDYLEKARLLGDVLIVAINDNDGTQRMKGSGRPIVPSLERARLVGALKPVSAVLIFEDDTASNLLLELRPSIYVKGGDYAKKNLPERPTVEAYGGQIILIDYLPDHSTTQIIQKIKALPE